MTLHTLVHSCDSSHTIVILFNSIPLCQLWSKSFLIFLFLLLRVYINYSDVHSISITYYMYSNVTTSTRINIFKCTYVHLCLFPFETNGTNAFQSTLVCWPIMQHGVRIEAVFASLQQGEHMVESMQFPAYIQSSRQVQ